MRYTNRADLLIAAGESIKMQESFGIIPVGKYMDSCPWALKDYRFEAGDDWEFPLAVVEGKAVFVGDELYNRNGVKFSAFAITKHGTGAIVSEGEKVGDIPSCCSWNPPKPATVMVELIREDAEYFGSDKAVTQDERDYIISRLESSCRKALEGK